MTGFIAPVDKPAGMSSFQVISALRKLTGFKKVGHAGTLDPEATGLLLIAFGDSTKQLTRLLKLDKTYLATITLGSVSTTEDKEGEITTISAIVPEKAEVEAALNHFTGKTMQVPSAYSALKINGQRAYTLAREGRPAAIEPREININQLSIVDYSYPNLKIEVECSSGTYIRALARDIGVRLKTGAYLSNLSRIKIGPYRLDEAVSLEEADPQRLEQAAITLEKLA